MDIDFAIVLAIALSLSVQLQAAGPCVSSRWVTHLSSQELDCAASEGNCMLATRTSRWARKAMSGP